MNFIIRNQISFIPNHVRSLLQCKWCFLRVCKARQDLCSFYESQNASRAMERFAFLHCLLLRFSLVLNAKDNRVSRSRSHRRRSAGEQAAWAGRPGQPRSGWAKGLAAGAEGDSRGAAGATSWELAPRGLGGASPAHLLLPDEQERNSKRRISSMSSFIKIVFVWDFGICNCSSVKLELLILHSLSPF